jgi:hypothetical protein
MATGRDAGIGVGQNGDSASVGGENGRRKKVELLQEAIHGLLEENRVKQQQHGEEDGSIVTRDQEEDLLLSSLLSKVCIYVSAFTCICLNYVWLMHQHWSTSVSLHP